MEWAKKTRSIRSYSLALIFLFQARRLASLSLDDDPMKDVSSTYEDIETLIEAVLVDKNRDSQTKPRLPRRESCIDHGSRALFRVKNNARKGEDPYTNIEKAQTDTSDNEKKSPKFRKSILVSPKLNDHLSRRNRSILRVQIHGEPNDTVISNGNGFKQSNSPIMPRSFYSPMTPSSPISTSASPKKLKFFINNEEELRQIPPVDIANYVSGLTPTKKVNGFEPAFHTNLSREISNVSEDHVTAL